MATLREAVTSPKTKSVGVATLKQYKNNFSAVPHILTEVHLQSQYVVVSYPAATYRCIGIGMKICGVLREVSLEPF